MKTPDKKTMQKFALIGGGILILLFLWGRKVAQKKSNVFNVTTGTGGDIVMGDVNLPDLPNYYGNNGADGQVPGYNNSMGVAGEYIPMFGMVTTSGKSIEKDILTPIRGAWSSTAERDAYYREHNIDPNGYQHSIPGNYMDNFTMTPDQSAMMYLAQQNTTLH